MPFADAQKGCFGWYRSVDCLHRSCRTLGLCVDSATLVSTISFPENFHTAGICALLTLIGLFFTAVFYTRKMKGAILYGILLTWILGMLCQVTGLYVPTPDAGFYSLFPSWA